jgi:hypothetical protein
MKRLRTTTSGRRPAMRVAARVRCPAGGVQVDVLARPRIVSGACGTILWSCAALS